MPTVKLRYAARAHEQIGAIYDYIAQSNPVAATMVAGRIRAAAERLRSYPRIGRAGVAPGTFEWVVRGFPYIIVYELQSGEADTVMILNVFHGAQDR